MIRYEDISIEYDGKTVLQHFSLHIKELEKVVLWGKSGSGKTSLMSLLPGFQVPASGAVWVDGQKVDKTTIDAVRTKIAWVPQEAALPFETVKELVEAPFAFKANKRHKPEPEVVRLQFGRLGLEGGIYEKRLSEVSGGEQQRIMLVVASLLQKKIILLDEPTSALDPESIELVIDFLKSLEHTTMLAISHDRHFTESFLNYKL